MRCEDFDTLLAAYRTQESENKIAMRAIKGLCAVDKLSVDGVMGMARRAEARTQEGGEG